MSVMAPHDAQRAIEYAFGRKHIKSRVVQALNEHPEVIGKGVQLLEGRLAKPSNEWQYKRLLPLEGADLHKIVVEVLAATSLCQEPEMFTSVVGRVAGAFNMEEKAENIALAAEVTAILCWTDAYDIFKESKQAPMMVVSRLPLPTALKENIRRSIYLPPMLCQPQKLKDNCTSPYLTLDKDCLILGKGNAHTGDICLDVLNIQNNVKLRLCSELLNTLEETPPKEPEKHNIEDWERHFREAKEVYSLILQHGGEVFLPYKVDKRGRMYSLGYHVNTQGYAYKKASLELADAELVQGVPDEEDV